MTKQPIRAYLSLVLIGIVALQVFFLLRIAVSAVIAPE